MYVHLKHTPKYIFFPGNIKSRDLVEGDWKTTSDRLDREGISEESGL